jgi:hypothetical protein
MIQVMVRKCNDCGKTFQEWACDYCYTKSVLKSNGEINYAKNG